MTEKERMISGELYIPVNDDQLQREMKRAKKLTRQFNSLTEEQLDERTEVLKQLFKKMGKNCYIEPSIHCDYGSNISVGDNFYANYDCIFVDVCSIIIGDNVMFGPRVNIFTAGHPIDAKVRNELLEFGKPVTVGDNVWIGGNAVLNPGITIGDNVVIGSGSVVTKDIPSNVIAVGNPCRVLREISDADKSYWEQEKANYYRK